MTSQRKHKRALDAAARARAAVPTNGGFSAGLFDAMMGMYFRSGSDAPWNFLYGTNLVALKRSDVTPLHIERAMKPSRIRTSYPCGAEVSTVFLPITFRTLEGGATPMFETMVLRTTNRARRAGVGEWQMRTSSVRDAKRAHAAMVKAVMVAVANGSKTKNLNTLKGTFA